MKKLTKSHKTALIIGAITLIVNNLFSIVYFMPSYTITGSLLDDKFGSFYRDDFSEFWCPMLLTVLCLLALGFIFNNRIKLAKIAYILALIFSFEKLFRAFIFYNFIAVDLLTVIKGIPFIIVLSSITIATSLIYTRRIISNDKNSTSSTSVLFIAAIIAFIISLVIGIIEGMF